MYVFINRTRFLAILIEYYALTKVPPQNNHIKYKKYRLISSGNNKPEYETPFQIICAAASPIIRNSINLPISPSTRLRWPLCRRCSLSAAWPVRGPPWTASQSEPRGYHRCSSTAPESPHRTWSQESWEFVWRRRREDRSTTPGIISTMCQHYCGQWCQFDMIYHTSL